MRTELETVIDLTSRQMRVLDTLLNVAPSAALAESQLFARVWRLEMEELELLFDAGLVKYYRRGAAMVWWLSAQGRRYARELREARDVNAIGNSSAKATADDADRCGATGTALQGAEFHASPATE